LDGSQGSDVEVLDRRWKNGNSHFHHRRARRKIPLAISQYYRSTAKHQIECAIQICIVTTAVPAGGCALVTPGCSVVVMVELISVPNVPLPLPGKKMIAKDKSGWFGEAGDK
jgi:hypothetical protein